MLKTLACGSRFLRFSSVNMFGVFYHSVIQGLGFFIYFMIWR